jgi:hypothetical protein
MVTFTMTSDWNLNVEDVTTKYWSNPAKLNKELIWDKAEQCRWWLGRLAVIETSNQCWWSDLKKFKQSCQFHRLINYCSSIWKTSNRVTHIPSSKSNWIDLIGFRNGIKSVCHKAHENVEEFSSVFWPKFCFGLTCPGAALQVCQSVQKTYFSVWQRSGAT